MASKRVDVKYDAETHSMTFAPVAEDCDECVIEFDEIYPGAIAALLKTKNGAAAVSAFVHGNRQKGGDSYSSRDKVPDSLIGTTVSAIFTAIAEGNWNARGVGDGVSKSNDDLLALVVVTGKTEEECRTYYATLDDDGITNLRAHKGFALAKKEIRDKRAADKTAKLREEAESAPELTF